MKVSFESPLVKRSKERSLDLNFVLQLIYSYILRKILVELDKEDAGNCSQTSDLETEDVLGKMGIHRRKKSQLKKKKVDGEDNNGENEEEEWVDKNDNDNNKERLEGVNKVKEAIDLLMSKATERINNKNGESFGGPNNNDDDDSIASDDDSYDSSLALNSDDIIREGFLKRSKRVALSTITSVKNCFNYIFPSSK